MKWLTKRHIALYLTILMLAFLVAAFAITKGTPLHKEDTHYLYSGWLTAESRDPENEPYFEKGQNVYQLRMVHELDDTVKGKVLSFRTYDSYVDAWFCDSPDIPADNDSAFYHFGETLRFPRHVYPFSLHPGNGCTVSCHTGGDCICQQVPHVL